MVTKSIKFTDYNGKEREVTEHFNINKIEVTKLDLEYKDFGGLKGLIEQISKSEDIELTFNLFEKFILASYGKKSEDGVTFKKRKEDVEAFVASEAYVELFVELANNPEEFAKFIEGILPKVDNLPAANT